MRYVKAALEFVQRRANARAKAALDKYKLYGNVQQESSTGFMVRWLYAVRAFAQHTARMWRESRAA
jgi:hypothetical protein